ncbi:hypothetical protein L5F33_10670 [Aliarcobacter butzleri]|uniref:hypothetical protein n=1 Tax=Aliarcobacter butzleri TaxID=28197 RepID=UPI001EE01159|nr:hypothetical protein [Aliarcobacter butzleri]MCG3670729.1 hypothetical protein [Aliarcobacter butzleri]
MCKNTNFECIKTTIKIFIFILLLNLLATVLGIEYSPFYWLSNFTYDSLPLVQNDVITNSITDKWAIRGQIGDIMSGHFSALAFLAVALSIIYQIEANKQMRESIKKQENAIELQAKSISQQSEALKLQSISLEAQIKELQEARIESSKQTEEFFIQNMNVKLDRYYKLLEDNISKIKYTPKWYHDTKIAIKEQPNLAAPYSSINFNEIKEDFDKITKITDFIYSEILNTKAKSENAYTIFNEELKIRLNSNSLFSELKEYYEPFKNKDISKLIN